MHHQIRVGAAAHQKKARPLHNRILTIAGLLSVGLCSAGVVIIIIHAQTDIELFFTDFTTMHVGLALIGTGVLAALVSVSSVLKNQLDLAALPPDEGKAKRRARHENSPFQIRFPKETQKPAGGSEEQLSALVSKLPSLADDLRALVLLHQVDVPSSLNKMRYISEKVMLELCTDKGVAWGQGEPTLERMIGPLVAAGCIPKSIAVHVRTVQTNASPGSHYQEVALSSAHVTIALSALTAFLNWFSENSRTT
jgi:hypothetical protein